MRIPSQLLEFFPNSCRSSLLKLSLPLWSHLKCPPANPPQIIRRIKSKSSPGLISKSFKSNVEIPLPFLGQLFLFSSPFLYSPGPPPTFLLLLAHATSQPSSLPCSKARAHRGLPRLGLSNLHGPVPLLAHSRPLQP